MEENFLVNQKIENTIGGAEGDRTPDLRIANATLSRLSYGPDLSYRIHLAVVHPDFAPRSTGCAPDGDTAPSPLSVGPTGAGRVIELNSPNLGAKF